MRIHLQDDEVVPDDRRTGGAPLPRRQVVRTEVDLSVVHLPAEVARDIVRKQAHRPERCDHHTTVRGRSSARVGGLNVSFVHGRTFHGDLVPPDSAGLLVDGREFPRMPRTILRGITIAVEPWLERGGTL